jgi:hypothetical protein
MKTLTLTAVLTVSLLIPGALLATEFRGETASGAQYLFEVPPGWFPGSGAVLYNHGYDSNAPDAPSIPDVLKFHLASKNLAIISSGYSQRGWALFNTPRDYREAMVKFRADFGDPGRIFAVGGSLGGLVAMQQAEQNDLGTISGVYALCAPLGGSKVWDQALDVRLTYDALCSDVSGGDLPSSDSVPFLLPESAVNNNEDSASTALEVAAAAARCVGLGIDPALRSSGMRERRQRLLAVNRLDDAFLDINLYYATFGLSDLYFDPGKLNRGMAFENRQVDYGDSALNASIRRVAADPLSRLLLKRSFTPSGRFGSQGVKVLTTTTTGDGLVVPEHQSALLGKLDEFGWARAQVREAGGSHCGYSDAETLAGFDALYDWGRGQALKPDAAQLNVRCENLRQAGAGGSCRYEDLPTPVALDTRIRERTDAFAPTPDARYSGLWFDPQRPGEGYVVEVLKDGRALLAWYTYPPPNNVGDQRWVFAEGRVVDNGLVFDDAFQTRGGVFGLQYDPSVVRRLPFGKISLAFDRCGHGFLEYQSTDPLYGSGRHEISQLTHNGANTCAASTVDIPQSRFSGAWGGRPAEGIFINVQGDGRVFATWYTYDLVFSQVWLFGEGRMEGNKLIIEDMLLPRGGLFGSDFSAPAVRFERWGRVEMDFSSCTAMSLKYNGLAGGYGIGALVFNRVTIPAGVNCVL